MAVKNELVMGRMGCGAILSQSRPISTAAFARPLGLGSKSVTGLCLSLGHSLFVCALVSRTLSRLSNFSPFGSHTSILFVYNFPGLFLAFLVLCLSPAGCLQLVPLAAQLMERYAFSLRRSRFTVLFLGFLCVSKILALFSVCCDVRDG